MILWEEAALKDREQIFEFLYHFNPAAAEQTDTLIETKAELLEQHPALGVTRDGIPGRLLIIPEISMLLSYHAEGATIRVMRVLHQKQQFPTASYTTS